MRAMGPQEDYIETVVTCEGDFDDPELHNRLEKFRLNLKELLSTDSNQVILKKVEPWNSVRVTFNITKEAALRLKQLAQQGNDALRSLGVLAVQIEGDQIISLTIAGSNNERAELILKTSDKNNRTCPTSVSMLDSGLQSSDEIASPGPSTVEATRKNIADYLRKGTSIFDTIFTPNQSVNGSEVFRSPNVVATSNEPIPFKANNILSSSHMTNHGITTTQPSTYSSNFPPGRSPTGYPSTHSPNYSSQVSSHNPIGQPGLKFPSPPGHAVHPYPNMGLPPPPPYPHNMATVNNIPRQSKTVTAASPLLVNLLQTDPLVAGLSGIPGHKMLPPNDGGPPIKKKRRPRKPKDPARPSVDGEIPIESVPNPALDQVTSTNSPQADEISRIHLFSRQKEQSVVDSASIAESDYSSRKPMEDPFPPEVTAGKLVNPSTGKLEPIDKLSDLSPNKTRPVVRSVGDTVMSDKLTCSFSDKQSGDLKLRIGPLLSKEKDRKLDNIKQSMAATSTFTTQNIPPLSISNSHPTCSLTKRNPYNDKIIHSTTVRPVAMDIYATDNSSHRVNSNVNMTSIGQQTRTSVMNNIPSVYSGVSLVPNSDSSVMHTLSSSFSSGTNQSHPNKLHNVSAVSSSQQVRSRSAVVSPFSSDKNTAHSQDVQLRGKIDSLPSLNYPNMNTEVHSITGSPNGKVSCEDDGSNHSGIINDINPEGSTSTVSPIDTSGSKIYNHDSGVGSSSERSDDTPSEPGDEFRTTQIHVESSSEDCSKNLKYSAEMKNSKVMTVGYVMNHAQSSAQQNINSVFQKDQQYKINKLDHFLYGHKRSEVNVNCDKQKLEYKHHNGPLGLLDRKSLVDENDVKTELSKSKSPGFRNAVTIDTSVMKEMSAYLKDIVSENDPLKLSNSESKSLKQKEVEAPKLEPMEKSSHYVNNCNDWPDLSLASSIYGINQINADNFDSNQFEGLEFDSPPNSEKFAGFTEQDILQATAKGLAYKAQAALDGAKGSNITSKYSKRSSPVNVNMLNHLYAPGLPLPRRLTESVQRLVKPLPSNELSLPHSRACKSPGSSKNSNGPTSPRNCFVTAGGTRSPGSSICKSASSGAGQGLNGQNNNSATSQMNYNSHLPTSCSNSVSSSSSSNVENKCESTYLTYSVSSSDYQHHSKYVPIASTRHDSFKTANDFVENIKCASQDARTLQAESVPSSECNISVGSNIGAGFHGRNDSSLENHLVHPLNNLCAIEQKKLSDLSESASDKDATDSGSVVRQTKETHVSDVIPASTAISNCVNSLVVDRSDDSCVPPIVSSQLQHSTSNLSGSVLTTQTSVSYSRQHGVSLSCIDISKALPAPSSPNLENDDFVFASQNTDKLDVKPDETETEIKINAAEPICDNSVQCSQTDSLTTSLNQGNSNDGFINSNDTDLNHINSDKVNCENDSPSPETTNLALTNHIAENTVVTASESTVSDSDKELENTPPLLSAKEVFSSSVESEMPQRRLTRKRKSNNSESESCDAKEIKLSEDSVIGDVLPIIVSVDEGVKQQENNISSEEKLTMIDDGCALGRDDDMMNKRGRKNKPLAIATAIGHSFFDPPVIHGRTRSQSVVPTSDKVEQREDVQIQLPPQKRATRSVKQKDQNDTLANKRRRSRDHR